MNHQKQTGIVMALVMASSAKFAVAFLQKLAHDLLIFATPLLLKLIISFAKSGEDPLWKGILYAFLLLSSTSFQTLLIGRYFHNMFLIGVDTKSALTSSIYQKSLTMSLAGKKNGFSTGEIVNLMSVDTQRIIDVFPYINLLWSAPLQIGLSLLFLWRLLGPSVLAGLIIMLLMIPLNIAMANQSKKLQMKQMKEKDHRVKMMSEILQGIKILKLYAWEPSFQDIVGSIRKREIDILKQMGYLAVGSAFIWHCAPFVVSLVTFATYVLSDRSNILDSEKAFVALSLFNIMRFPLSMLPMIITNLVQASVAVKRITSFLERKDLKKYVELFTQMDHASFESLNSTLGNQEIDIHIEKASFHWEEEQPRPTLSNINLTISKGSLVAIVGTVGSGKSSLLSAILGEMQTNSGLVKLTGSVAYVAQQAWIQNATIKNNIIFEQNCDENRYNEIVEACALKPDLEILPHGDLTEIGENGINLSGGQKQRVSLARAVNFNANIYLLDDPLSAVDSHVGRHIFNNVIGPKGLLADKTRILVTHSITFLQEVDQIVVLKDGEISEMGSYDELMERKGAFSEILIQFATKEANSEEIIETEFLAKKPDVSVPKPIEEKATQKEPTSKSKQYQAEKTETGNVKLGVFFYYFINMGIIFFVGTVLFFTCSQFFAAWSNVWLSKWSDDEVQIENSGNGTDTDPKEVIDHYLGVYAALGFCQALMIIFGTLSLFLGALAAARKLHDQTLFHLLRSPMSYFDTTPQGRILNRLGKDVDVLDTTMPTCLRGWLNNFMAVASSLILITYTTPIFLIPILIILVLYYMVQRIYVACSRQLKRLESVTRSPIYSHFGETLAGVVTIRAYGLQKRFISKVERLVDDYQQAYFPSIVANRWLSIQVETLGNLIIFCAALLAVLGRETLSPGLVGLSVSYAMSVTQALSFLIRMTSEVETNIVAAERLKEYVDNPQEAEFNIAGTKPDKEWPQTGKIVFKKYSLRYREDHDLVLKKVSFEIEGGQKVGIVGRTGAGKSSLTLGLFRLVEPAEGEILIDGINIATLGLHELRSKLTIIPQDPVLFSGSIRINLDPFSVHSDDQLWNALKLSNLHNLVQSYQDGLEHQISEGGKNLSVGERQLVCLARACLRKTQILILDEATAAVDLGTDELIQKTIREEFKTCTVITIAHRINTILDYDKVLVLAKGEKVEFESPSILLKNEKSTFYAMCSDAALI